MAKQIQLTIDVGSYENQKALSEPQPPPGITITLPKVQFINEPIGPDVMEVGKMVWEVFCRIGGETLALVAAHFILSKLTNREPPHVTINGKQLPLEEGAIVDFIKKERRRIRRDERKKAEGESKARPVKRRGRNKH